jgi:competence ComEA-like helix-hairpin-helix protein
MKRFRGILSIFLALLFVMAIMPANRAYAGPFIEIPDGTIALVVRIIDVNAVSVRTNEGEALVRLIGISPGGDQAAIHYLQREIGGRYVVLTTDPLITHDGRWNYMYIHLGNRLLNREIVLSGYGMLNENHHRARFFEQIRGAAGIAHEEGLGLWANEGRAPHIVRELERLNVNTATSWQIQQRTGAAPALANAIVSFRNAAPFQQISDLVFVPGMTRVFFEQNRHRLGVSTNINTAIEEELLSIFTLTQAQAIINSRSPLNQGPFNDIQDLVSRNIISQGILNPRAPFIDVEYIYEIDFSRPAFRANMNLASHPQLTRAGLSSAQANAIIAQRQIMPMRNLQDLAGHTGFSLANLNTLGDNLRPFTNINTAPESELESLFGTQNIHAADINRAVNNIIEQRELRPFEATDQIIPYLPHGATFSAIAPYIYVDERPTHSLLNVNRATVEQLVDIGLSTTQAHQIFNHVGRGNWNFPGQLPVFIRNLPYHVQNHFSVRTNINTATAEELLSLDPAMTDYIVRWIMNYRQQQHFGNAAELQAMFVNINELPLYSRIARFIIFR